MLNIFEVIWPLTENQTLSKNVQVVSTLTTLSSIKLYFHVTLSTISKQFKQISSVFATPFIIVFQNLSEVKIFCPHDFARLARMIHFRNARLHYKLFGIVPQQCYFPNYPKFPVCSYKLISSKTKTRKKIIQNPLKCGDFGDQSPVDCFEK